MTRGKDILSINAKMVHHCTISKVKAISGAVICSLKGTKDRFGHSLLCFGDSLAFEGVSHPRFDVNNITSGKFFDGGRCCAYCS